MKEKICISLDVDILNKLDVTMARHQFMNRSKFIEYLMRQVLLNPVDQLNILIRQREHNLSQFKVLNEDILKLQDYIEAKQIADDILRENPKENKGKCERGL